MTDTYVFDAFGTLISATGSTNNRYLYTGEQFDPNLGLYYLRARLMNPLTGRFWSMDSYEGTNDEPHSLHKYLFAEADPIANTDPTGHEATLAGLSTTTAIEQIVVSAAATVFLINTAADGLVAIGDFNALLYGYSQPIDNLFARAQARAIADDRIRSRGRAIIGETFNPRVLAAKRKYPDADIFPLSVAGAHEPSLLEINRAWIRAMMFLRYTIIDIGFDTDRGLPGDLSSPARGDFYVMELNETRFYPFKAYDQFPPSSALPGGR